MTTLKDPNPPKEEELVIWKSPFKTITYSFYELIYQCKQLLKTLYQYCVYVALIVLVVGVLTSLTYVSGPYKSVFERGLKKLKWCLYWVGLGVLSSVGLGTGLHTFLLYLGPHIASVTMAAYECGALNFPEPPYPEKILCPDGVYPRSVITMVNIMRKVWLEATMWGAGTALGELPPYFVAKTARLTGTHEENLEELKLLEKKKKNPKNLSLVDRAKLKVEDLIKRVGFFGILVCASVPNPLFDLAGIMCGHFLVPFWTFFGATLIGKAIIKVMIQKVVVITVFNEALVANILMLLEHIPKIGSKLQNILTQYLAKQKEKLHNPVDDGSKGFFDIAFNGLVFFFISYFLVSILNSSAQNYQKRENQQKVQKNSKKK